MSDTPILWTEETRETLRTETSGQTTGHLEIVLTLVDEDMDHENMSHYLDGYLEDVFSEPNVAESISVQSTRPLSKKTWDVVVGWGFHIVPDAKCFKFWRRVPPIADI